MMDKLSIAMLAGARAIENSRRYHQTYVYDVNGKNSQEISYCEAARILREESENIPLSPEEMDTLVNEPVYIKHLSGTWYMDGWHILCACGKSNWQVDYGHDELCGNYGIAWYAYRSKPKEDA